ncbi:two pore calcium channel protein 1A isoform X2 [Macadamia integrifolia]|uniref:two pore calcium channel protein 1A isoform X2 n=1 Tax=Macadamia integrifolia TaxID=60698 RepID=UPI001C532124|nr:two pore calcium channel protein 1A isoform X2 [Macadamia integrifolia]
MESPLLGGESSGNQQRGKRTKAYHRRSDAITYGTPYQKAAALIDLAEDGIGIPEEVLDESRFERAAKFYFIFIQFDFLWSLNLFALIVLNFLEKPLWCAKYGPNSCNNREYFFLGQLPYLTGAESLSYEVITLLILVMHTLFPISYEGVSLYWRNPLNKLKGLSGENVCSLTSSFEPEIYLLVMSSIKWVYPCTSWQVTFLLVLVADLFVYALYISPVPLDSLPLRVAPYIRVLFFVLNIRELRACIVTLAGMMDKYLNVLALGLLFLLFSSWLAYIIFEDTQQGKTVFYSYDATLYQMFVLFTTSNNPDVWIPAYKDSRWNCLFFVVFVLLGVYFLTNLILAVVYDSFKGQLVKQVAEMDSTRKRILEKAFSIIDRDNCGFLDKEQCIKLFEELNRYRSLPKISKEEFELIFDELDDSRDFKINKDEFAEICNAIALRFQKEPPVSCLENYPIYHSPTSEKLKAFVQSNTFEYIIAFFLMLNLVAVIIETTLDIKNSSAQKIWQEVEFVFGWIYVLEMALKIYALGFHNYWLEGQNRFDFIVTWIIVVGETATFFSPHGLPFLSNGEWIRYLLIARLLRLIRLLMHVKRCRAFVATFLSLIPSLMPYLGTIFCVLCIYCSLGLQIFGGIVNSGNTNLEGTDLYENDYLLFNFNDYPNGMVTLFNLLVMNNWQVWMEGYKELTGTSWSITYFVSFYLITVVLLLNLVVAFVLEAFFAEMELETGNECDQVGKEAGRKGRPRYVGSKTRSQRVDALLHHMLSAELSQTQCPNP